MQEVYTGLEEATTSAGHRLASGISSSIGNNFPSLTYNFNKYQIQKNTKLKKKINQRFFVSKNQRSARIEMTGDKVNLLKLLACLSFHKTFSLI